MPTYQYACTDCQEQLEVVQSFSDAALTECPQCGGRLRKKFGAVGVVFKGSGFYKTDSRSSSSASDGAAKTETKAETKSDTKSDTKSGSASTSAAPKSDSASSSTPATKSA